MIGRDKSAGVDGDSDLITAASVTYIKILAMWWNGFLFQ